MKPNFAEVLYYQDSGVDEEGSNFHLNLGFIKTLNKRKINNISFSIYSDHNKANSSEFRYLEGGLNASVDFNTHLKQCTIRPYLQLFDRTYEIYNADKREDWQFLYGISLQKVKDKNNYLLNIQNIENHSTQRVYHYRKFKASLTYGISF